MVAERRPRRTSGGVARALGLERELQALARGDAARKARARRRFDARDLPVVVRRIVMIEHELTDARRFGQARALLRRRVAPAALARVLVGVVLPVVDEHGG